jgi:hypothetical protein
MLKVSPPSFLWFFCFFPRFFFLPKRQGTPYLYFSIFIKREKNNCTGIYKRTTGKKYKATMPKARKGKRLRVALSPQV